MKVKIFIFFYTYSQSENDKEAKILVISKQNDMLEIPNIELGPIGTKSDTIEKVVLDQLKDIGIEFDSKVSLIDIIWYKEENELCLYYSAYFPDNRVPKNGKENIYLQDISGYVNHNMIRKFLCSI